MKKIIAARPAGVKTFDKMGRTGQPPATIKRIIDELNGYSEMEFYCIEDTAKRIIGTTNLINETLQIADTKHLVTVVSADKVEFSEKENEGALPSKNSLRQLKKVANSTKGVCKAGRTKNQGNLLDKNIETETKTIYDWYQFNKFEENLQVTNQSHVNGGLPENTLKQLEKVREISKSTDIGEKTRLKGPNMDYDRSALDVKVETYDDFVTKYDDFIKGQAGWTL